jgi:hypothetical protein
VHEQHLFLAQPAPLQADAVHRGVFCTWWA